MKDKHTVYMYCQAGTVPIVTNLYFIEGTFSSKWLSSWKLHTVPQTHVSKGVFDIPGETIDRLY